jgi:RNA polymerase sigma-70 factor (ECF subfamily)
MPASPDQSQWFAAEVQPHTAMLRAWLASRFPQLYDLDDVIQEACARVLAARTRDELRAPKAFLFATARNLALDLVRRRQLAPFAPLGDFDDLSVLDEGADVAETAARNQEIELLAQALQTLPDRCRQVMTLRNVYGLAHRDIAAQLGISVRTVEAQIALGLKRCTAYVRLIDAR